VLRQVLVTFGFMLLFQQAALDIWGGDNFIINPPAQLMRSIVVGSLHLPLYRIFMIALAAAIGLVLWLVLERTRVGAMVRPLSTTPRWRRGSASTRRVSRCSSLRSVHCWRGWAGVIGGAFLGVYPLSPCVARKSRLELTRRDLSPALIVLYVSVSAPR
jgi:branched-chain amino acid transport system permease protein